MSQNTEHNVRTWDDHADNACIAHLAGLMREKMKFSREVKGRSGWQDMPVEVLSVMLREHVEKGDPVDVANFCMMIAAKRATISEARGAAEERAKAAEGDAVYMWRPHGSGPWYDCLQDRASQDMHTRTLYTRPVNVAALEARVKELEDALKEAASALEQVKDGERGGYNARNGKFVSLQMSDGERADIIHSDVTNACECALEKSRAALTREGQQP